MVVPEALRVTRLRPGRRFTNLGRMCSEVGWKHWDTIKTLEAKRKTKSAAFWTKKKEVIQVRSIFQKQPVPCPVFLFRRESRAVVSCVCLPRSCGGRRPRRRPRTPRCRRCRRSSTSSRSPPPSIRRPTRACPPLSRGQAVTCRRRHALVQCAFCRDWDASAVTGSAIFPARAREAMSDAAPAAAASQRGGRNAASTAAARARAVCARRDFRHRLGWCASVSGHHSAHGRVSRLKTAPEKFARLVARSRKSTACENRAQFRS